MPKSKQGEQVEQSQMKRSLYSRQRQCSTPRDFCRPTTTGKIARNPTRPGPIGRRCTRRQTLKCIKAQANKSSVKFGAANSSARLETTQGVETNQGVDEGGMKALEGYFDNLTAAAVNKNWSSSNWWKRTPSSPPPTRT